MSSNYASVKLSGDFVDQARREAEVVHRSVGAQVEYWAKLGRAVENTPGFGIDKVRELLEGRVKFEDLSAADQDEAFLAFGAQFDNPGPALRAHYAELGKTGRPVRRGTSGRVRPAA